MEKITDILLSKVVNERGEDLGHVFELRSAGEPEHGLTTNSREITEVLYGKRAFLEMLGLKETKLACISIEDVINIEPGKITVSNRATPG
jgi:hypothetical protein